MGKKHVIFPLSSINYMFSVNYIFFMNITYVFAIITCLGFLVLRLRTPISTKTNTALYPVKSENSPTTADDR